MNFLKALPIMVNEKKPFLKLKMLLTDIGSTADKKNLVKWKKNLEYLKGCEPNYSSLVP